jgi:hypothetical protein
MTQPVLFFKYEASSAKGGQMNPKFIMLDYRAKIGR